MDRRVAKELLHIRDWLSLAYEIVMRGRTPTLRMGSCKNPAIR